MLWLSGVRAYCCDDKMCLIGWVVACDKKLGMYISFVNDMKCFGESCVGALQTLLVLCCINCCGDRFVVNCSGRI